MSRGEHVTSSPIRKESLERNRQRQGHARVPDLAIFATRKALVLPSYAEGLDRLYRVRALPDGEFAVKPWTDTPSSRGHMP